MSEYGEFMWRRRQLLTDQEDWEHAERWVEEGLRIEALVLGKRLEDIDEHVMDWIGEYLMVELLGWWKRREVMGSQSLYAPSTCTLNPIFTLMTMHARQDHLYYRLLSLYAK